MASGKIPVTPNAATGEPGGGAAAGGSRSAGAFTQFPSVIPQGEEVPPFTEPSPLPAPTSSVSWQGSDFTGGNANANPGATPSFPSDQYGYRDIGFGSAYAGFNQGPLYGGPGFVPPGGFGPNTGPTLDATSWVFYPGVGYVPMGLPVGSEYGSQDNSGSNYGSYGDALSGLSHSMAFSSVFSALGGGGAGQSPTLPPRQL